MEIDGRTDIQYRKASVAECLEWLKNGTIQSVQGEIRLGDHGIIWIEKET